MAKPNPLSRAAEVAASLGKVDARPEAPPPVSAKPAPSQPEAKPPAPSRTSREGKRFLGYYVDPAHHEEIKQAALDEGIQMQELLRRAVDDWMAKHGGEAVVAVARRLERRRASGR